MHVGNALIEGNTFDQYNTDATALILHATAPFFTLNVRKPYLTFVDLVEFKTNTIDNFYTQDPGRFMDVVYKSETTELASQL